MAQVVEKRRHLGDFCRYHLIRLHRLAAVSHDIALGVAFGVLVSFTPFIGFHLILCTVLCILFGGSKVASWIGSLVGNPATFPLFYWADYWIGVRLMSLFGSNIDIHATFELTAMEQLGSWEAWQSFLLPILVGSTIMAPLAAGLSYLATFKFVELTRKRHQQRIVLARQKNRRMPAGLPAMSALSHLSEESHAHSDSL